MLSVHNLTAYSVGLEFLELSVKIINALPQGFADDADQLRRAAKSIVRNIAEGAGRRTRPDKAKHYAIARGEAMECVGSIDALKVENTITAEDHARGLALLERLAKLLTGLVRNPGGPLV